MADHHDDSGGSCTRHAPPSAEALMALATLGSRMPGFHHDCASKLQTLMMSLDEIGELSDNPDLRQALDAAQTALRDLQQLFTTNRSLAKTPQLVRMPVTELLKGAADRASVRLKGDLAPIEVEISPPAMTHVVSVLLDIVAGPAQLGRTVHITTISDGAHLAVTLAGPPKATAKPTPNASELLAIASYVLARDGGELRCGNGGEYFTLRLLRSAPA